MNPTNTANLYYLYYIEERKYDNVIESKAGGNGELIKTPKIRKI